MRVRRGLLPQESELLTQEQQEDKVPVQVESDCDDSSGKKIAEELFQDPMAEDDELSGLGEEKQIPVNELEKELVPESMKRPSDDEEEMSQKKARGKEADQDKSAEDNRPGDKDKSDDEEKKPPKTRQDERAWPMSDSLLTTEVFLKQEVNKKGRYEVRDKNMTSEEKTK